MTDVLEQRIDGRNARAARTRNALLLSCRSLMRGGSYRPPMNAIAKKGGVSLRSAFQHFTSAEQMWRAALEDVDTYDAVADVIFGAGNVGYIAPSVVGRAVRAVVLHERAGN